MPSIIIEKDIYDMSEEELNGFPLGVIELDKSGTIITYNAAAEFLAHRTAGTSVGLDFFRDVAPCTAVRDFQGRFFDFVKLRDSLVEEFRFVFRFAWGDQEVGISMVRQALDSEHIFLVVNAYRIELVVVRA